MGLFAGLSLGVFAASYLGVRWVREWALRRSILAIPNVRSSHDRPMPYGGGWMIVAFTLLGFVLYAGFAIRWPWSSILAFVVGGLVVAVGSWMNDRQPMPIATRLLFQSFASVIAILGVGYWHSFGFPWPFDFQLGWTGWLVTFIWVVGLINIYNFMDGIDGIAASQGVVAGLGWAIVGWLCGQQLVIALGLLVASSSLGFLGHNWPPARIFMGDVGSAFLGYALAILPVIASQAEPRAFLAGIAMLWPFLFDSAFTFLRRLIKRENVFKAHRSHLYQRLVITGRSHRFVTLLYILLALLGALLAFAWMKGSSPLVAPALGAGCLGLWLYVRQEERSSSARF